MQLTLKWKNHNTLGTMTTIYRSETPISVEALPEPIATVNANTEQYVDTVEYGKRYFYRMQNTNATGSAFTGNKEVWGLPRTGPGPQNLKHGDMECGYFGFVPHNDLISSFGLFDQLAGSLPGTPVETDWLKFAHKGKILFIATSHIATGNSSMTSLYNAGLMFGTDDNGPHQYGPAPVNQLRTVTAKGDEFIVRSPRMSDNETVTWDGVNDIPAGEWYDLIIRSLNVLPTYQIDDNFDNLVTLATASEYAISNYKPIFQEKLNSDTKGVTVTTNSDVGMTTYASVSSYGYTSALYFRPVLELIADLFL
ncbi:hypothetical protein D9M68_18730 [compost metagenome]